MTDGKLALRKIFLILDCRAHSRNCYQFKGPLRGLAIPSHTSRLNTHRVTLNLHGSSTLTDASSGILIDKSAKSTACQNRGQGDERHQKPQNQIEPESDVPQKTLTHFIIFLYAPGKSSFGLRQASSEITETQSTTFLGW